MNHNSNTLLFILKTLYSPLINSYIILFYLLTATTSSSSDPKFDACQPKTCGNNQNISYPFYVQGLQEPFCGYPGFGISCAPNGFPILDLSNTQYIIHQIFYENQSLRVSNAVFSNSISNATTKGCLPRAQNLTLPNIFSLAPNQKDMILFFGCDSQSLPRELQEHSIGCYAENETSSVIAIYKEDKNISFVSNNCKGVSVVVDSMVEDGKGGIEEALRKGLLLKWTASNCSECSSTGGRCGFDSDMYSFRCYCTERVHSAMCDQAPPHKIGKTPKVLIITAASVAGVAALVFLACFAYLLFWRKKNQTHRIMEEFLKEHGPLPTTRYSYSEVKKMTNSFRNKLGQGGYGCVYEGKLHDGQIVAVKVLSESKGDGGEFINEVASISKTSHVNVVRLLGFCLDGSKRALIYEFMPNGSLEKFIFDDATNPSRDDHQLNCKTLYDIAIGIARGLEYLHRGCNTRILHFDIKPHNILLDVDFCPKISDFGLAKICPRKESVVSIFGARGTIGYMAPELFSRNFGGVSHKSDVYSYGMMVLEMVGQRKNIKIEVDRYSEIYFPHWIYKHLELNQQLQLQCIKNENDEEIVRKMIVVSFLCIQIDPSNRPTMSRVPEMLEGSLEVLQIPPKSFLSFPSTS